MTEISLSDIKFRAHDGDIPPGDLTAPDGTISLAEIHFRAQVPVEDSEE
jgi:hypothetical protein